jgi:hypothetical protein
MDAAKPSYVREVLTSQTNLYAGLGSLALGVVLSIPFGFGIGALPLIAFAAGDILAALHIRRCRPSATRSTVAGGRAPARPRASS